MSTDKHYSYNPNPLMDEYTAAQPGHAKAQASVTEPPKLFDGGTRDLPSVTASGIDPNLLMRLPYGVRHAAASAPDLPTVHGYFDEFAGHPGAEVGHDGLRDARNRFNQWARETPDPRPDDVQAAEADALYTQIAGSNGWPTKTMQQRAAEEADRNRQRRELEDSFTAALREEGAAWAERNRQVADRMRESNGLFRR
ncbi:hypothetical protein [Phycicoccus avicenniae]|uniref:hypothetical protein n=1 Tax=Phycicoccus avicenniae TaxID=2828860 RepID=UPI003D271FF2